MDIGERGSGYVRVLLETPKDSALAEAAKALLVGQNPHDILSSWARAKSSRDCIYDPHFGAAPIAAGAGATGISPAEFDPDASARFIVRAFVKADSPADVPASIEGELVHSDPPVGRYLTNGNSQAVGNTMDVQTKLDTDILGQYGLDGAGVAVAIVDTGIFLPRLTKRLGAAPAFDTANSWSPISVVTPAGMHRIGHGTMCAYDALIAAPKATLLDIAMLIARPPANHTVGATVSAAMQAYWPLISNWVVAPVSKGQAPNYEALVVSNSWGIFHPSLDFPPGHPGRFIDNPNHIFRLFIKALAFAGVDVVFSGSNCGPECPSAVCLSRSAGMIMGANAYDEVLTLAGCDIHDERVGYSSKGPSIANMPPQKPDLTAYTHFLGSKVSRNFLADTGTSAACAVAAGCVAALRTRASRKGIPPAALFQALKDSALKVVPTPGWDPGYGYGIIRPVAAARALGLIP
jgi:Subtilase family